MKYDLSVDLSAWPPRSSECQRHLHSHALPPIDGLLKQRQRAQVGVGKVDDAVRPLAARRCARHAMHEAGGRSGHRMAQQPHVQLCGERAQSRVRDLKLIEHLRREASMCSIKLNQAHRAPEEGGKHVLNQAQSSSIERNQ